MAKITKATIEAKGIEIAVQTTSGRDGRNKRKELYGIFRERVARLAVGQQMETA